LKIENPKSKVETPEFEGDFGGEFVPFNLFESTREWLERQGIKVSKIPKRCSYYHRVIELTWPVAAR
jgi:hypothetical protein